MIRKLKLKKDLSAREVSPAKRLMDKDFIAMASRECLDNNDFEGVIEVIEAHLEVARRRKTSFT